MLRVYNDAEIVWICLEEFVMIMLVNNKFIYLFIYNRSRLFPIRRGVRILAISLNLNS